MKKKKAVSEETGGHYWKNLEEARKCGVTADEFEQIKGWESLIAEMEHKIDDCKERIQESKREIKLIKKNAKKRQNNSC